MNNTTITYNRKKKQYELTENGRPLETFPAGPEGEQAAKEAAIKHDDPQAHATAFYLAYDLFRGNRDLFGRIWRAARIVADGGVRPPFVVGEEAHTVARVKSQQVMQHHKGRHYAISRPAGMYHCDCFDFVDGSAPSIQRQRMCKHIIAMKIMKLIGREPEPWQDTRDERDKRLDELIQIREEARQRQKEASQYDDEILAHAAAKARRRNLNAKWHNHEVGRNQLQQESLQPEWQPSATATDLTLEETNTLLFD